MHSLTLIGRILPFIYGLYLYILQQILFFFRFGKLNTDFNRLDFYLIVVGIASIFLYSYFVRKSESVRRKRALQIAFVIAVPFSVFGSLMGGLLGGVGILIFGLVPFLVILLLTHLLFRA